MKINNCINCITRSHRVTPTHFTAPIPQTTRLLSVYHKVISSLPTVECTIDTGNELAQDQEYIIKEEEYRTGKMCLESNVVLHIWHGIRVMQYCVFCVPRRKNSVFRPLPTIESFRVIRILIPSFRTRVIACHI